MAEETGLDRGSSSSTSFPWHLGVYDAHCHPTDSMRRIQDIQNMKAKALTIMATRSQDQRLVSEVNKQFELQDREAVGSSTKVIPAFGWHPWFSHQIYDDSNTSEELMNKELHYKSVLTGTVEDDSSLIKGFPDPRPLSNLVSDTRSYLEQHPQAMVGEIGLDRSFRIPENFSPAEQLEDADHSETELTPGGREGRRLTAHRVDLNHQRAVLKSQLHLAGEMGRAVSVHGVAAHGVLYDTLRETWKGHEKRVLSKRTRKRRASVEAAHAHEDNDEESDEDCNARSESSNVNQDHSHAKAKPYPPRICLHSYSGPPQTATQYLSPEVPAEVFFSFSKVINFSTSAAEKAREVIRVLPEDRILVESDLHCAGERMDELLEEMVREVCRLRDWELEDGVRRLGRNWRRFAFGSDSE